MADARLDIDDALSGSDIDAPVALSISRTRERLAWASSLLLVGLTAAAMVAWATRSVSVPPETTRTILSVAPTGETSGANPLEQRVGGARPTRTAVALSPDGKTLVFDAIWGGESATVRARDGSTQRDTDIGHERWQQSFLLARRSMGRLLARRRAQKGSSQWRTGGDAVQGSGALRGELGRRRHHRVCATAKRGLVACVGGGRHSRSAHDASARRVQSPAAPHVAWRPRRDLHDLERAAICGTTRRLSCGPLTTGEQTVLITGGADGRYVSTGHLVYVRLGTLMAAPFDPVRLAVTGGATGVIDGVMQAANRNVSYMAQYAGSPVHGLRYGGARLSDWWRRACGERSLAWVDRQGTSQALPAPPRSYSGPRLSPDGQHVAVFTLGPRQVWRSTSHAARSTRSLLTGGAISAFLRQMGNGSSSARARRAVRTTCIGRPPTGLGPSNASPPVRAARRHPPGRPTGRRSPLWKKEIPRGSSVRYLGVVDRGSQDPCGDPHGRQRDDARILPGRPVAGVRLQRVRTQRSLRAAVSRPRRASPDFHQRRRATSVEREWSGTVLCARRGSRRRRLTTLMSVRIATAPAFLAGTPEALFESADLSERLGKKLRRCVGWTAVLAHAQQGSANESGARADDLRAALV